MKLQERALARKYAQAFMHIFGKLITPEVVAALAQFVTAYNKNKFFYIGMTLISASIKIDLMLQACDSFGLREVLRPLVVLLAAQMRLPLLYQVVQQIVVAYKKAHHIIDVQVQYSPQLDAQEQQIVQKFLQNKCGGIVQTSFIHNPDLIAGIRLQGDTFLWEHSIAQQLRSIAQIVKR